MTCLAVLIQQILDSPCSLVPGGWILRRTRLEVPPVPRALPDPDAVLSFPGDLGSAPVNEHVGVKQRDCGHRHFPPIKRLPSAVLGCGPPPCAWGQQGLDAGIAIPTRFTPTCVGTTEAISRMMKAGVGSPPRAWGQRTSNLFSCFILPVHPHVRGDNRPMRPRQAVWAGSPPRAWGQRPLPVLRLASPRFTPTCVGTTRSRPGVPNTVTVHPHVRGDNPKSCFMLHLHHGSPPRAWGQRFVGAPSSAPFPVHPHVRGDNGRFRNWPPRRSVHPHVRGDNGFADYAVSTVKRFTPTCVGTTRRVWGLRGVIAVHPHVRGDNVRPLRVGIHNQRFTPTCVGTTSALFARKGDGTGSPPRAWEQRITFLAVLGVQAVHPHVRGDN